MDDFARLIRIDEICKVESLDGFCEIYPEIESVLGVPLMSKGKVIINHKAMPRLHIS